MHIVSFEILRAFRSHQE